MKIGVITLHRSHNYGAVLQCYALQKVLMDMGHDVQIIDFAPAHVYGYFNYHIFSRPLSVKSVIRKVIKYFQNKKRTAVFKNFLNNNLNLTKQINSLQELKKEPFDFDAIICGSDQVWNLNIIGSVMGAYYLDFTDNKTKKIAYSASYEQITPSLKHRDEIKRYLHSFDAVSLREDNGIKFTSELWGKKVIRTLDPSMLLTKEDYHKISKSVSVPKKYMLVYMIGENKGMERFVRFAADRLNLPIINLSKKIRRLPKDSMYIPDIGPSEFIYLMENANCVCTNSFHGTCFSIINNKPFLTFSIKGKSTRLHTLLKTFDLQNRMVWKLGKSISKAIDYLKVDCEAPEFILNYEIYKSLDFLKRALK